MLTPKKLHSLIKGNESNTLEFKLSFQKEVIQTISAFANSNGGDIIIGVNDSGDIIGTEHTHINTPEIINTIKQSTSPSIIPDVDFYQLNNKNIMVIHVDEYPVKPVACKGRYYQRRQNSNHQMTAMEISNAHLKSVNSSWDYYPDPDHNLNDISFDNIQKFIRMANLDDTTETILNKFELVKDKSVTFGAYLLFTNNDMAITTTIEAGRFTDETTIKDALTIRGDLFSEVTTVMTFIQKHINKAYIITGDAQRKERWDYPPDALREIIINMIVHRDYRASGHSTIKIFNDRIEFFNYGPLPEELTIDMIKSGNYRSMPRNLQIASVFKEAGLIEKYGSGIKRVIKAFLDYNLQEPVFEEIQAGLNVTVHKQAPDGVNGGVNGGVKSSTSVLLDIIINRPGMNTKQISKILNTPAKTVEKWIKNLKDQNLIEFKGAPKIGGYYIKQ